VKIPRFNFDKFPGVDEELTTQMKAVGEVMSIGRNFPEALNKAWQSLESWKIGLGADGYEEVDRKTGQGTPIETLLGSYTSDTKCFQNGCICRRNSRYNQIRSLVSCSKSVYGITRKPDRRPVD
jgi:hypothetical protein